MKTWGELAIAMACCFCFGVAIGGSVKACEHDYGRCEHARDLAQVKAILDCLERTGR